MTVLSKNELQTPRTAADMLEWVYAALERFNTKELKAAAREGKHFAKELTDEALPMALFAQRFYDGSPDVTITHVVGNQQYDGTVEDRRKNPSPIRYIEATVSYRDYTESLRMELLNREGSVPAYGEVRAEGSKGRRTKLEADSVAENHNQIRERHIAAVVDVVRGKVAKNYPNNTALVVGVDDAVPFREDDDVAALDDVARSQLVPLLSGREFKVLAMEGSQRLHLVYELADSINSVKPSDNDDAKSVAHYQTLLAAWINVNLERDRTLMTLATAGIGLLVTILTAVGIQSLWIMALYAGAFIGFLGTIGFSFQLYRANAQTLSNEITQTVSGRPNLRGLDQKAMWSFVVGVALSISMGVASAIHSLTLESDMEERSTNGEKFEKSLDGIENLRPNRPTDQTQPANKPSEPAQDQSQKSEGTSDSE